MKFIKTRILMASSVHRWNDGRIYYKEARSLAKFADVRLIAVRSPEASEVPDGRIAVDLLPAKGLRLGDRKSLILRLKRIGMVTKTVLHHRYDVFHFHDPELIPVGWLAKLRGKKVIYDMHEDAFHVLTRREWIPKPLALIVGIIIRGLEFLNLLIYDRFILAEKAYAKVFTAKKCFTVLNFPIIEETFEPVRRRRNESLRMVYVGSITNMRGAEDILRSIRDLRVSGRNITLDLYGNVAEENLQAMIMAGIEEGWLKYHGWIPGDTILRAIRRCHVGLSPLRDHPGYRYIWPTKVLEYVAAGLAIVASSLPGTTRLLKDLGCAVFYPPGDVEALKKAILSLYQEDIRVSLAENGAPKLRQYSWASQEAALVSMYHDVLR